MVPSHIENKNMKHVILLSVAVFSFGSSLALPPEASSKEGSEFYPVILALVMIAGGVAARIIEKRKSPKPH